jgi:hypothetical protein
VRIKIYAPAGKYCVVPDYTCPLFLEMGNTPACYCLLIPDSWWWNYERPVKHKLCPALLYKSNELTDNNIKDQRLRILKKAIKNHTIDSLINGSNNSKYPYEE